MSIDFRRVAELNQAKNVFIVGSEPQRSLFKNSIVGVFLTCIC